MDKYITDERTGLKYELVGDYYLIAGDDEPEERPIGIWGATALAVSEATLQNSLRRAADKRKAERLPCRSKWAGGEYVLSVGKRTC